MKSFFKCKPLLTFMVIVGTVVGSGFLSGKEIVVFFTRFGKMSYFCIALAFLLFWGLFYFFLKFGSIAIKRLEKSKISPILSAIICFILSSAMFAGIYSLVEGLPVYIRIIVMWIVLMFAVRVAIRGSTTLEKLNLLLVPIMIVFLIMVLIRLFAPKTGTLFQGGFLPFSVLYCILYVVLNTCNSAIVIASYADELTDKQKVQVSFFSALALSVILLLGNIVLLQNSYSFGQDMPLLYMVSGLEKFVMSFIILLGCSTTLFSLVYTVSSSLKSLSGNKWFIIFFSVVVPFVFSFLGFGVIVSFLYPLTSIIGVFLLCDLFLIPLFKKVDKKVHSRCQDAKQDDGSHD